MREHEKTVRHHGGYCQDCDSQVPPALTHPPMCEQCDAKIEDDCKRIEQQMREYEGDDTAK